jgi:hypothetical protein
MLQQLANQLQAAEGRQVYRDNLVPFIVLFTFLLTFWLTYSGITTSIVQALDLQSSAFAGTAEINFDPSVTLNGYTFDQTLNPDWYYTQGYGYPQ